MLVVDASVALKWLVDEGDREMARRVLASDDALLAPDFQLVEVANSLWKKVRRQELSAEQAEQGLSVLPTLLDTVLPTPPLINRALAMSVAIDHPVYDCLYLACAEASGSRFVSADKRFMARLAGTEFQHRIQPLSDFASSL